ncbi:MAG: hypothetical protein ACREBU_04820 [Nitrososphaera sp.]
MRGTKFYAIVAAAFMAGAFLASPELRAYAANTVGLADIINESIQSEDIKNGQVKAADIGADAVGGSELIGVTKLLFGQCTLSSTDASVVVDGGGIFQIPINCAISGVDSDDSAIATLTAGSNCFDVAETNTGSNKVTVILRNNCQENTNVGPGKIGIIVFDK